MFTIVGGYVCEEVYAEARARNLATHKYGLVADQILEAQAVLASGAIVMANACQNTEPLFVVRGGGSYGVFVSIRVMIYPPSAVSAQTFGKASLNDTAIPQFMDALTVISAPYPDSFNGHKIFNHFYF